MAQEPERDDREDQRRIAAYLDIETRIAELAVALQRLGPAETWAPRGRARIFDRVRIALELPAREAEPQLPFAAGAQSDNPRTGESTMEEILESIRRIVDQDAPAGEPVMPPPSGTEGAGMSNGGDLTDAKIARSEAQTETKITRLEGKIDTMNATLVGEIRGLRDELHKADQYNPYQS